MYCNYCRTLNPKDAVYCSACGQTLNLTLENDEDFVSKIDRPFPEEAIDESESNDISNSDFEGMDDEELQQLCEAYQTLRLPIPAGLQHELDERSRKPEAVARLLAPTTVEGRDSNPSNMSALSLGRTDPAPYAGPELHGMAASKPESFLKRAAPYIILPTIVVGILLLVAFLLRGMVWVSEIALPWLQFASEIAFGICLLVFLPLCIFRKTRPWAGLGFYWTSFVFGTFLFAEACIIDVQIWGYGALFVGLFLAGVGVVPVALIATAVHSAWPLFGDVVIGVVLTFGTRYLGVRLLEQQEREEV